MLTVMEVLLFIAVGAIVSLDVAGLTAVKPETYVSARRNLVHWAARNGFWHAALLFTYGIVAVGVFDLALPAFLQWLIVWLSTISGPEWMVNLLVAVAVETRGHFSVFFALATIAIVWQAYRRKILENPLASESEEIDWQRRSLRSLMKAMRFPASFIKVQLQSVAVAMDMLALAFLLKSLNLFNQDWARVAWISLIIFLTVTSVTWITAITFRAQFGALLLEAGEDPEERRKTIRQVLLIIRLTEPLLIFYFISELVAYLVWHRMASSSLFFLGSALLVFSLIKSVTFRKVCNAVDEMVDGLLARGTPAA